MTDDTSRDIGIRNGCGTVKDALADGLMYAVGRRIPLELRETALGGCAATPSACEKCGLCS